MPRLTEAEKAQAMINLRISGFEKFEAAAPAESSAKPCCKTRGNLRSDHADRQGNSIAYRCQVCGCRHRRIFADPISLV
jgi:hypothetical protein